MNKYCTKCKKLKPVIEFSKDKSRKQGYNHRCKSCSALAATNSRRLREFGISLSQYNKLFESQEGKCKICGISSKDLSYTLCVDHNHKTNQIRGLLCKACNLGIGYFRENSNSLEQAIIYLIEHNGYINDACGKVLQQFLSK